MHCQVLRSSLCAFPPAGSAMPLRARYSILHLTLTDELILFLAVFFRYGYDNFDSHRNGDQSSRRWQAGNTGLSWVSEIQEPEFGTRSLCLAYSKQVAPNGHLVPYIKPSPSPCHAAIFCPMLVLSLATISHPTSTASPSRSRLSAFLTQPTPLPAEHRVLTPARCVLTSRAYGYVSASRSVVLSRTCVNPGSSLALVSQSAYACVLISRGYLTGRRSWVPG